jgi:hypothetical protein
MTLNRVIECDARGRGQRSTALSHTAHVAVAMRIEHGFGTNKSIIAVQTCHSHRVACRRITHIVGVARRCTCLKSGQLLARAGITRHKRAAHRTTVAAAIAACHGLKALVVVVARRQAVGALRATAAACAAAICLPHAFCRRPKACCSVRYQLTRMIGQVTALTIAVPSAICIGHTRLITGAVATRIVGWIAICVPPTLTSRAFTQICRARAAGSQSSTLAVILAGIDARIQQRKQVAVIAALRQSKCTICTT